MFYPLWGPLVTLSKYIHVRSSFKVFIETDLMVQSKFNLVFWFVSYNIFYMEKKLTRSPTHSCARGRRPRAAPHRPLAYE
jgi:hypothetical protein